MASSLEGFLRFALTEIVRHKVFVVGGFVLLCVGIVYIGTTWPKVFTSSTSIYVEEQNIIGPLMEGAAVQTEVIDRSGIAREIIYGRKIMLKVVDKLGYKPESLSPAQVERLIDDIKKRTVVTGRRNLITIEYSDSDPKIAYEVTRNLATFFIAESLADKVRESTGAYEFIDKQAQEYKAKLVQSEEELKKFRSEHVEAQPGVVGDMGRRNAELTTRLETISQELREARIRRASLMRQLSGEAEAATNFSRSEQYKTRIAELQSRLDTLRLSYHETYPDIVQLKAQIQELRDTIAAERGGRGEGGALAESAVANPLYQELQRSLYQTNTQIETLAARYEQTQRALDEHVETGKRVQDYEAKLAELTRDYEINREIYADLTRRRESARVSMNIDKEEKGLTLRIDEPAYLPHKPSGPQFIHFVLAAPIIGALFPIGIVVGLRKLDPRIRSEDRLTEELGLPMLGLVPHMASPEDARRRVLTNTALAVFLVSGIGFMILLVMQRIGQQGS